MAQINRAYFGITNTPGAAGDLTVGAAVSGPYRTLGAAQNGQSFEVSIVDGNEWEIRTGCTYTSGTNTLTRGTLEDSSTGSAIALTSSAKVMVTASATRLNRSIQPPTLLVRGAGGTAQSVTASTWTKIGAALSATATLDTLGGWDGVNKRYQPTLAGTYLVNGSVKFVSASNTIVLSGITKNGSATREVESARLSSGGQVDQETTVAEALVFLNGSTDYVELFGFRGTTGNASNEVSTYLQAIYLGP